jgi:hypothetical protein
VLAPFFCLGDPLMDTEVPVHVRHLLLLAFIGGLESPAALGTRRAKVFVKRGQAFGAESRHHCKRIAKPAVCQLTYCCLSDAILRAISSISFKGCRAPTPAALDAASMFAINGGREGGKAPGGKAAGGGGGRGRPGIVAGALAGVLGSRPA